jgi:hypothetical protein
MEHLWEVLLHATASQQESLSCEECFVLLDYLADLLASGYRPQAVLPLAQKYLQRCPRCDDEFRHTVEDLLLVSLPRESVVQEQI